MTFVIKIQTVYSIDELEAGTSASPCWRMLRVLMAVVVGWASASGNGSSSAYGDSGLNLGGAWSHAYNLNLSALPLPVAVADLGPGCDGPGGGALSCASAHGQPKRGVGSILAGMCACATRPYLQRPQLSLQTRRRLERTVAIPRAACASAT